MSLNRPRAVSSPDMGTTSIYVSDIKSDEEGGIRVYVGPRWRGHYCVIEDPASRETVERAWWEITTRGAQARGRDQGRLTIPTPPPEKLYCERNGLCSCERNNQVNQGEPSGR